MAQGAAHQGIIAVCGEFKYSPESVLFRNEQPCVVVLDGVEDPHNLGAVIRTAEASNVAGVVVPERHSAPLSDTVAKASAGASAYMPVVRVGNLVSFLDQLKTKGLWIVGVDASGENLWTNFDYTGPVALVFGGEHRGLRRLVREHCDVLVRLPMLGKVESLNISVTAGIVLYEVVRQRTSLDRKSIR
jgi:23S rRNA (guanosine2251-2'-O)-methyltransferase